MTDQSSASVPLYAPAMTLVLPLFRVFSCWFWVFFLLCSFLWFLVSRLGSAPVFFFSFSVQFPQFFFFVCVSAKSSLFKTKTNGGKSTSICCWLSDQKFPWVLSLFVPFFFFCFSPSVLPPFPQFFPLFVTPFFVSLPPPHSLFSPAL